MKIYILIYQQTDYYPIEILGYHETKVGAEKNMENRIAKEKLDGDWSEYEVWQIIEEELEK